MIKIAEAWVLFGIFFFLLTLGVPISICLGLSAVTSIIIFGFPISIFAPIMYSALSKFTLLAIPFFILAGVIMEYSGISKRLIKLADALVGHVHGGLAIVTVIVASFFAAMSGSGPATVAAIGVILIPGMVNSGYNKGFSAALVASAGDVGIIIPPSIALIVFAVLAEVSIGRLFIAGIIPGILFGIALIIISSIILSKDKKLIKLQKKTSWKEKLNAFKDALWGLFAPIIILGCIYTGITTPTEAANIAVVYSLFVGVFIYREIHWKIFWKILLDASIASAIVMFIIANASVFAWFLTTSHVAIHIAQQILSISDNKYILLIMMNIIFLVAGCFIDAASAFYIFVPIMLPIIHKLGIDPVVFGIFMTMNLAIGMSTPPVGLNIFVASNISGVSLKEISIKVIPFVMASIVVLLIVTFIPSISLWLPNLLGVK